MSVREKSKNPISVFICHRTEDKPKVGFLCRQLLHEGFAPWVDEKELRGGSEWEHEIEKAIRQSDFVLICLSRHYSRRGFFHREIRLILRVASEFPEGYSFVIPVLLDENPPIPPSLIKYHCINFNRDDALSQISRALEAPRASDYKREVPVRFLKVKDDWISPEVFGSKIARSEVPDYLAIEGEYFATGFNEDGSRYGGLVTISKDAAMHNVEWQVGNERFRSKGKCIGRRLCVRGDFDIDYNILEDGSLEGSWEPGTWERLTTLPPELRHMLK